MLSDIDERTLVIKKMVIKNLEGKLETLKGREKRELEERIEGHQADISRLEKLL